MEDGNHPQKRPAPAGGASAETPRKPDQARKAPPPADTPGKPGPAARPQAAPQQPGPGAGQPGAAASPAATPDARPQASSARLKRRHYWLALSFLVWVLAPLVLAAWYLFAVAEDQYASHVGFAVRTEEVGSAIELLGGITELSGSSSSDTDILYEYIQSQQLVREINNELDLGSIYRNPDDPIFGLGEDARIEALSSYWNRMVKIFYDRSSGLIEVRVLAFDAESAHRIAQAIFDKSSAMINELSTIARADAMRYAQDELERSQERLKEARQAITAFRNRTRIVDPQADIQGQMGLITSLQSQLADAIIERQLLLESAGQNDPRVVQANRRIEVIREQIDEERGQFGDAQGDVDTAFSRLLEEYEALSVDLQFAEQASTSARAAHDAALAEAQRQSRYLASYVAPTLAETAEFPRRYVILGVGGAFLLFSWAIMAMVYYSLRDRR